MGREKKYTPASFKKAVDKYFDQITRTKTAEEMVPTGRVDSQGHMIFEPRTIENDKGEPITYTEFVVPPSMTELCLQLGISRETLSNYGNEEEYIDTITRARGRIEAYLEGELLKRNKVQGVIFNLKNNYGWKDKQEVSLEDNRLEVNVNVVE